MKRRMLFMAAIFLLLLIVHQGCQETFRKSDNKPGLSNDEMERLVLLDTSYVYPEAKAKEIALGISAKFLDAKDGVKRTISNLVTVPSLYATTGKTLIKTDFSVSKPHTPSLYIANFKDKKGYVILSADKRAHEILAMVAGGTIDQSTHIGLRIFLENAVKHTDEKVAQLEALRGDNIFNTMVEKLQAALPNKDKSLKNGRAENIACGEMRLHVPGQRVNCAAPPPNTCTAYTSVYPYQTMNFTSIIRTPLLTTLWDQGPPFNNGQPDNGCSSYGQCSGSVNSKYLAGCVAVAEGQVVAHFAANRDPAWQSIVTTSPCNYSSSQADAVSTLLHDIYLSYGIYVSRKCGVTGAGGDIGDIHVTDPRGICPANGLVEGHWRDWNTGDIRNSLSQGSPVVIEGMQHLCCFIFCWGCGNGHEWVIDGMRDLNVLTTYESYTSYTGNNCPPNSSYTFTGVSTSATQIHQNWGWGPNTGSGPNDWYAQDSFQSNYPTTDDINFNHANYIVAYITPL
jgi:hypothetical protein